jgi:hypothetical protein
VKAAKALQDAPCHNSYDRPRVLKRRRRNNIPDADLKVLGEWILALK